MPQRVAALGEVRWQLAALWAAPVKLALLAAVLCLGLTAQTIPGRYVLELAGDPAAVTAARPGVRMAARAADFPAHRNRIRQAQAAARSAVAAHGGTVLESLDTVINGLIVSIPDARANELLQIPGALKLHAVQRVQPYLGHALPLHKVPDAWNLLPLGQNGAGLGIKIGILDTGIDVNNPAFSVALPPVDGFPKVRANSDLRFTNAKVIVANNYTTLLGSGSYPDADDHDGHGTGTSLAAAGGPAVTAYGTLSGVAPMAYIGNYKVLGANGGSSDVIAKAIDDAVADGMDVLNLSLGAYVVSYSEVSTSEIGIAALERATQAGVLVVVAAGNQGPGPGTLGGYAHAPDAIAVGAIHNDHSFASSITLPDGTLYEAYFADGPNPGQILSGTLFDITSLDPTSLGCSPLPAGSVAGQIALVLRGTCTFESKLNNAAAGGAAAIIVYNSATGNNFSAGSVTVGAATLPALFLNRADGLTLLGNLAQNAGLSAALDFTGVTAFPAATDLSYFSSRGPALGSSLKPDLVAVGEAIVTGAQSTYKSGESYNATGFINTAGTSFSSPLVAGAAAVLKGARPGLTFAQYRSLLVNSGTAATALGVPATVSQAGTGMMNLAAAVTGTLAATPTSLSFGTGAGTLHGTLPLSLTNVGNATDTFTVQVLPSADGPAPAIDSTSFALDPGASQQATVTLDATGLTAGEYSGYLVVTGTVSGKMTRIPYWFAAPGGAPAAISVLYQDRTDPAGSTASGVVVLRILDAAGLPYSGNVRPQVAIPATSSGSVRALYSPGNIPGTWTVDVRTGATNLQLVFTIGTLTQTVTIPVV